ncbi:MAG: 2'-deoxycytidine 5'-triphosphate deaminase [Pelagibacteraceae bacterium]|nr:2'-deoxycytidine 5'-triphosphate deaminase [Pelagibacteraceae bacterium]PPR51574.1 MAG: Deoxycytidine triphosphate deaminase [Alphaproteobacteria bacterium MarineAlpha5_Bin10]|tara:strand:- start:5955 stop:7055 length:1101 start_codon:yes stop_codon:yes gene_type:complete
MKKKEIKNGALAYQNYKFLIENNIINSNNRIPDESIQPASIDLRLGNFAYRVSSSFLTINKTVEDRIKNFIIDKIDISQGHLFKKNQIYIVEVQESLNLDSKLSGKCNPKSSTGRLDILSRVISDYSSEYEVIKPGYKGKIYLEITSKTFNIVFTEGDKLSQLRLRKNNIVTTNDRELIGLHKLSPLLYNKNHKAIKPLINNGLKITAAVFNDDEPIAYKAKKDSPEIFFNKLRFHNKKDYWVSINKTKKNSLIIEPNEFYILKSKEKIKISRNLAAEMIPYDSEIGEFRAHYAGFFDPGFGNEMKGSHAVLEIKTYEVPFAVEDGQIIARLIFEKLAEEPTKIYGEGIKSNYQNQGLALSKHFRV